VEEHITSYKVVNICYEILETCNCKRFQPRCDCSKIDVLKY